MQGSSHLKRRDVVRQFVMGWATSLIAGAAIPRRILAASAPSIQSTGTLVLSISEFPVLATNLGSLRLDAGLDTPILINRSGSQFHAMSAKCAHLGCTVNTYDTALGVMRCPCHGSRYNIDGSLNQGPAQRGLDRFVTAFDGADQLSITLPGIIHAARQISLVSAQNNLLRFKLTFQAKVFTTYGVEYRPSLTGVSEAAAFSLSPAGPANLTTYRNTVFNANDPLPLVDLYVDAPGGTGFFSIVMMPVEA